MKQTAPFDQDAPEPRGERAGVMALLFARLRDFAGFKSEEEPDLRASFEQWLRDQRDENGDALSLSVEDKALLLNALGFADLEVGDVMVPRTDIRGVDITADLAAVVRLMQESQHTRLVVYRQTLDDVAGVVHLKDLLPYWGDGATFQLERITKRILAVPPSMRVTDLLIKMRQEQVHMAIVVDEYGGVDGLVTIEDLIEEIVGDIRERGRREDNALVDIGPGVIEAAGRVRLEDLEERLGLTLLDEEESEDVHTLSGLLFMLCERVPSKGERVEHEASGIVFEILESDPRRIRRVRVKLPETLAEARVNG